MSRTPFFGALRRDAFPCGVAYGNQRQEELEDLAVAQVVLEQASHENRDECGDRAVQNCLAVSPARRQPAHGAPQVPQHFARQPQKHQQHRDAALGGVLNIDIVQVAAPAQGRGRGMSAGM
jgi:hypothetical protein